jgi:Ca2+-binding RTX toxin-like protein
VLAGNANVEKLVLDGNQDVDGFGNSISNMLRAMTANLLDGGERKDFLTGCAGADQFAFPTSLSAPISLQEKTRSCWIIASSASSAPAPVGCDLLD